MRASSNPSKAKGTAWESDIVGYLREHHNSGVHRNVQTGARDIGDVAGYYLHALEAKAEKTITLADYIAQANREAVHAGQPFGCAVVKRRMKGVADGYVVRDVRTDVRLLNRMRDMEDALRAAAPTAYELIDRQYRGQHEASRH
ncbi:glycosylphosphatidylinositol transamidase (GPIT) subunit GPI8 [Streptomyces sp. LBL]|uniref:hypothetical protein n=1 Tax=Streptomyces sp. LBL TaxID=2940562 RepID=UPI002475AC50|nr:hypothetical protein [Streptomyces sp. LBL]MDH6625777.1 glycosylphosphatidylinositol transamidase (GPIT) subunit GPI8 [Streptomyces sp. LBL]